MLTNARAILGDAGQIAPMSDTTARVTYAGGGFRLLDVGGFATVKPTELAAKMDSWLRQMLLADGELALPDNLLPVIWRASAVPEGAVHSRIGEHLVEGVLLDGIPVTTQQAKDWNCELDALTRHARSQLGGRGIQPTRVNYGAHMLTVLTEPVGSASAWALFANLLKSVTGLNERHIVFLPDPSTCVVVGESRGGELEAAAAYAAEAFVAAAQPLSPVGWVRSGTDLVRYR